MRTVTLSFIALFVLIIAACSTSKKSTTSTASTSNSTITPAPSTNSFLLKPAGGVYAPGDVELTAIQAQYKDVTLEKLKLGHAIYTQGACVNCHKALSIYDRGEAQWKNIIENMAAKANMNDSDKDAVYKYVLAIKATQAKDGK